MSNTHLTDIRRQVMWDRLLAVVEEQAQTLVRTAFSTSAREAGDISAGVFDRHGRMLAQAVTGTPGHVNSMARAVVHFLEAFPAQSMRPGDAYVTNDPWKGTGHLHDFTMVSPTFRDGELVALFASTTHVVDIGGIGLSPDGRQVYHEGLFVPITPLMQEGEINEWLVNLVRHNVREPEQVEGDLYALVACNDTGRDRLLAMMDEYELSSLDELGHHIIEASERAMRAAVDRLPSGSWEHSMRIDGYETPIDLVATVTVDSGEITVDFTGSSGVSDRGINCPMCYTEAYTAFGVKCLVAPTIPNNHGSLAPIRVSAPENTIVHALPPAAVVARSTIGHMLPDVVFGCFNQAVPGRVPAEGTSNLWNVKLGAGHGMTGMPADGAYTPFTVTSFHSGGAGARPAQDGLSATPYPSGVRNVPVEITEAITPLVIWRKDFRTDSGGPGRQRGGLGQVMEIASREPAPFGTFASFERVHFPARGRDGGLPGAKGRVRLASGESLRNKGFQVIPAGDRLIVEMPGGGGVGSPQTREPQRVVADVKAGLVTRDAAQRDYKVVICDDGSIDEAETARLRSSTWT